AIPIRAPAKLFATDQLAAKELGSRPGSYHSATMTPWRTTTTACVLLPGWNAYRRAPSRTTALMPCCSGGSTLQPASGQTVGRGVGVGAGAHGSGGARAPEARSN